MMNLVETEKKSGYFELFSKLEAVVASVNRLKEQPIPIKINYKSSILELKKDKPFIVLFAEQHAGANLNEINFAKTNRSLLNCLVELCKDKSLDVKEFIKEGCSELKPYEKLAQKTTEELLVLGLSPLQIYINKVDAKKEVLSLESFEIFSEFALLSLLYASRPGNARFSDIEIQRILYLLTEDIDHEKYMLYKKLTMKIQEELKLFEIIDQKFYKKIAVENDFGALSLLALRSNIEALVDTKTLEQFDLRVAKALYECGKARDMHVSKTASKLEPGIYPMFFGDYHTKNLIENFKELGVPVIVLSPFL